MLDSSWFAVRLKEEAHFHERWLLPIDFVKGLNFSCTINSLVNCFIKIYNSFKQKIKVRLKCICKFLLDNKNKLSIMWSLSMSPFKKYNIFSDVRHSFARRFLIIFRIKTVFLWHICYVSQTRVVWLTKPIRLLEFWGRSNKKCSN